MDASEVKMTVAMSTGKSREVTALTTVRPTPGHEKIVSVTAAPDRMNVIAGPRKVAIGIRALRAPCRTQMARLLRPLARSVRIYSCETTSSMDARVKRE